MRTALKNDADKPALPAFAAVEGKGPSKAKDQAKLWRGNYRGQAWTKKEWESGRGLGVGRVAGHEEHLRRAVEAGAGNVGQRRQVCVFEWEERGAGEEKTETTADAAATWKGGKKDEEKSQRNGPQPVRTTVQKSVEGQRPALKREPKAREAADIQVQRRAGGSLGKRGGVGRGNGLHDGDSASGELDRGEPGECAG